MTFIIVCGGTAGHINPGLSIAAQLRVLNPESKILFIGADRDLEKRLIPQAGYELINIKMSGIKRGVRIGDIAHNIKTARNLISAGRVAAKIMKQENPSAVIGTGGYICYPVLKAAAKRKIPAFIHESNAKPGLTVRKLSAFVDKVMVTFPGFEQQYKHPERIVATGTPVRKEFLDSSDNTNKNKNGNKPLVVSFWGSLGAEKMNEVAAGLIKRNIAEKKFHHIHAAGNSYKSLADELQRLGVSKTEPPYADVRSYIDDMPDVMKAADLVICRAGGATLAELAVSGKPGILIPSLYVPDNVQMINAEQFEKMGAAVVIEERECNADVLFDTACKLTGDSAALGRMADASASLAAPDAAAVIAGIIMSHITGEKV